MNEYRGDQVTAGATEGIPDHVSTPPDPTAALVSGRVSLADYANHVKDGIDCPGAGCLACFYHDLLVYLSQLFPPPMTPDAEALTAAMKRFVTARKVKKVANSYSARQRRKLLR